MRFRYYFIKYKIYFFNFSERVRNKLDIVRINLTFYLNRIVIWWKNFKYQSFVFLMIGFIIGTLSIDREYSFYNKRIKYHIKNNSDGSDFCYLSLELANSLLQSIVAQKNITESDVTAMIENQEAVKKSMLNYYNSDKQKALRYKRGYNGN